jgi:ABC-type Mn2+/Zn2+ transport system ATPase subunit
MIRLKNASLGYGKTPVLTEVDLDVLPGSFWGILGHNGSGKTTILKTVLGLLPLLGGELIGRPRFGYVPQKERLDPLYPLSAHDVAAMGTCRRFEPLRRSDPNDLVRRSLADCGAAQFASQRFSDLSGGQKQRVLLARALASDPEILALDEPLAGVDITTQHGLLKLLEELKDKRRLTVLMVSHRVRSEKDLFSRIAWVDEGRVTTGTAEEMLAKGRLGEIFKAEL